MNLNEYKQKYSLYMNFSEIISEILVTAIEEASSNGSYKYNLQHIPHRAKDYESLKARLIQHGHEERSDIEELRKDLAGCRVIFYYNTDVNVFLRSGIIHNNFKVVESKIHGPKEEIKTVDDIYTANHFVIELDEKRQALPEYSRYKGLKCEIQVHTILNHALAQTTHDITYKKPESSSFGNNILDAIDRRFLNIWEKYLKPAGYEFQKIQHDYRRYVEGKKAFNRNIEEDLLNANDNNQRYDILQEFREYVLPSIDPNYLQGELLTLLDVIKNTISVAKNTYPTAIKTPDGEMPGKAFMDILRESLDILNFIAFFNLTLVFPTYIQLYELLTDEEERDCISKAAKSISKYKIDILKQAGFYVQVTALETLEQLDVLTLNKIKGLASDICEAILDPTVESISSSYRTVAIKQASLSGNKNTSEIRKRALSLLKNIYNPEDTYKIKLKLIRAFDTATRPSRIGTGGSDLLELVLNNCVEIIDFYNEHLNEKDFEILSEIENDVCRLYGFGIDIIEGNRYENLNEHAKSVVHVALKFRDQLKINKEFYIYKTLVGYDSVFENSWNDREWHYRERNEYRDNKAVEYAQEVSDINKEYWEKIIIKCTEAQSKDLATYPHFGKFLLSLANINPKFILDLIEHNKKALEKFLVPIIDGLLSGKGKNNTQSLMKRWIKNGEYLYYCTAAYEFYKPIHKTIIKQIFSAAKKNGDHNALIKVMVVASKNYHLPSMETIRPLFIRSIEELTKLGISSWIFEFWFRPEYKTVINILSERDLDLLINNLLLLKDFDYHAEYLLDPIAQRNPEKIMAFFKQRIIQGNDRSKTNYYDIPYHFDSLKTSLSSKPDLVFKTVIEWYRKDYNSFFMRGARLLHNIFPEFSKEVEEGLLSLISNNDNIDQLIVIDILRTYNGVESIYNTCRELVRLLPSDSELLNGVMDVLDRTGIVSGEDGFVKEYSQKVHNIKPWLKDENNDVLQFAERFTEIMEMRIIQEKQRAEERIELLKHQYGDDDKNEEE
ncbi:RelA/SpoT domain-containing protein [Legionella rowbothamii]|uniref:RelA/SpoT domain-containing protein n=1 Tax=Legionella rowbothamii TaxID=96229 RepID=UPI00105579AA|nr:RelA/SpoT domain-containing protein [Legionella rowbothamii]